MRNDAQTRTLRLRVPGDDGVHIEEYAMSPAESRAFMLGRFAPAAWTSAPSEVRGVDEQGRPVARYGDTSTAGGNDAR